MGLRPTVYKTLLFLVDLGWMFLFDFFFEKSVTVVLVVAILVCLRIL